MFWIFSELGPNAAASKVLGILHLLAFPRNCDLEFVPCFLDIFPSLKITVVITNLYV